MVKGLAFAALVFSLPSLPPAGSSLSPMRMTPAEIVAGTYDGRPAGGPAAAGAVVGPVVRTRVLFGDPSRSAPYTLLLFVPPRTTMKPHSHRDDRMATVVSGVWRVGYGMVFDEGALKPLPAGSVYSEPGGVDHFARSDDGPVVVQISGFGPTDTQDAETPDDGGAGDKD